MNSRLKKSILNPLSMIKTKGLTENTKSRRTVLANNLLSSQRKLRAQNMNGHIHKEYRTTMNSMHIIWKKKEYILRIPFNGNESRELDQQDISLFY